MRGRYNHRKKRLRAPKYGSLSRAGCAPSFHFFKPIYFKEKEILEHEHCSLGLLIRPELVPVPLNSVLQISANYFF